MSEMFKGVSFRLLTISVFWAVNTRIFFISLRDVLPYIFLITSNLQRRIFRKAATYITTLHKIAAKINTLDGKKTRPGYRITKVVQRGTQQNSSSRLHA